MYIPPPMTFPSRKNCKKFPFGFVVNYSLVVMKFIVKNSKRCPFIRLSINEITVQIH